MTDLSFQSLEEFHLFQQEGPETLKRPQLQRLCKACGLSAGGKNAEMIERLQEFFANSPSESNFCESTEIENKNLNEEEALAQSLETMAVDDEEKILNSMDTQEVRPRSKSVAEQVLDELDKRVKSEVTKIPVKSAMQRSKSVSFLNKDKWNCIHAKSFEKMDSIAKHYAAKRSMDDMKAKLTGGPTDRVIKETPKKRMSFIEKILSSGKKMLSFHAHDKKPVPKSPSKNSNVPKKPLQSSMKPSQQPLTSNVSKSNPTAVKPKFDLKASLSKPLGYKPYTGPLKNTYSGDVPRKPLAPGASKPAVLSKPVNHAISENKENSSNKIEKTKSAVSKKSVIAAAVTSNAKPVNA